MIARPPGRSRRRNSTLVPVVRTEPVSPHEAPVELIARNKWAYPVNPMSVGMDWGRRGYTCDRIADPPDKEWRDFVHETNELIVVLDGRLEIEVDIDGDIQRFDVMTGDELFVPGGANHTVRNMHSGTTRWLYGYQAPSRGFRSF
ncbi:MAG TPA: cupin domain-containing protein [Alphaproteobacteria bacterium]|nr:cupin domain-containing protein [Alphaproteobacteria bacterium]